MAPERRTPAPAAAPLHAVQQGLQAELRQAVGRTRWRAWFRDVDVARLEDDRVVLAVPTEVHRTWIGYTYRDEVGRACARVLGEGVGFDLEVDARQDEKRAVRERLPTRPDEWERLLEARRPPPSFASFETRPEDRWALLLLSSLVHGGSPATGGLYLHGPSGSGKTHLLRALEAAVTAQAPGECLYLTAKRLTSVVVAGLRSGAGTGERALVADLCGRRLVLLDGLDLLEGRPATQAALTRLLDRAGVAGPRFVIAGREHPGALGGLSPALSSRLMGGALVRLPLPDRALLGRVLVRRAEAFGVTPPPEVVEAVLDATPSPRSASVWIERWALASERLGRPLEPAWLAEVAPSAAASTVDDVIRRAKAAVARHYGLAPALLERPTKARDAALPRRVAIYLVYRATSAPLSRLARAFGFSGHSSASRALQRVRASCLTDAELEQVVDGLLATL